MQADWELSQSLTADGVGIRSACLLPSGNDSADAYQVLIGTQAGALYTLGVPSGAVAQVPYQHDHAITALLSSESDSVNLESPLYVTGCKDAGVRFFASATHALVGECKGHSKPVTSLAWASTTDKTTYLVSGSWDGTAKVWHMPSGTLVATLPGHENSVSVAALPSVNDKELRLVTGSAGMAQNNQITGHTVRLWTVNVVTGQMNIEARVVQDHDGPIRDVLALSNEVATCSNDGTVKLRDDATGQSHTTLTFVQAQHPPMLLSMATVSDEDHGVTLVASAEDGQVVFWNLTTSDGGPQVIPHPSSVWRLVACPQGDVATCGDDGFLRIFTRSTERMASADDREAFAQLAVQKQQSSGPSAEEIAKLPHWDDRMTSAGRSEGDVKVFQRDGMAIAAQWSLASGTWIEVGQVMGNNSSNDGQGTGFIDGVQYDHVLPVEIDQTGGGVATLQIGYNNGENHFVAAQRFIDQHMLPQYHLAQIADYLQQRLGQAGPTIGAAVPATTGQPMVSYEQLPSPGYKAMGLPDKTAATTLGKMKTKMEEFQLLDGSQLESLSALMDTLLATNRYHASKVSASELVLLEKCLDSWPPEKVFAMIDLARLTALHPDAAAQSGYWDRMVGRALQLCRTETPAEGPAATAIPMLSLRLFANCLKGGKASCQAVTTRMMDVVDCASSLVASGNKNIRLALATCLYNLAHFCHMHRNELNDDTIGKLVAVLEQVVVNKSYEGEAIHRALVALGTICLASPKAKAAAQGLFLASKVELAASPHGAIVKAAAKEVYAVLQ